MVRRVATQDADDAATTVDVTMNVEIDWNSKRICVCSVALGSCGVEVIGREPPIFMLTAVLLRNARHMMLNSR